MQQLLVLPSGNTAEFAVVPYWNSEPFRIGAGDRIVFRAGSYGKPPVLEKILTAADYRRFDEEDAEKLVLTLNPADTADLCGLYRYDCTLETASGERYTFIRGGGLRILPVLTEPAGFGEERTDRCKPSAEK